MKIKEEKILQGLKELYPNPGPSLDFDNAYQCLIAVMLSAQTNDKAVNKVTPALFLKYPSPFELQNASLGEVEEIIKSLGLYKNKAKNAITLSKILVEKYGGEVPSDKKELTSLPGVGIKTANVVGAACFGIPAIAVDTHVERVGKRLGYGKEKDGPVDMERKLEKAFPKEEWINLHYRLITFGRDICHSQKPECGRCLFSDYCCLKKKSSKAGR